MHGTCIETLGQYFTYMTNTSFCTQIIHNHSPVTDMPFNAEGPVGRTSDSREVRHTFKQT